MIKQDGLGILIEKDGADKSPKDYSNSDMLDILSPDKFSKKKKRRQGEMRPRRKQSQLKYAAH